MATHITATASVAGQDEPSSEPTLKIGENVFYIYRVKRTERSELTNKYVFMCIVFFDNS